MGKRSRNKTNQLFKFFSRNKDNYKQFLRMLPICHVNEGIPPPI